MKLFAPLLLALALPLAANADTCSDCRDSAAASTKACEEAAKGSAAALAECKKKADELTIGCDQLACKVAPKAAAAPPPPNACLDCRLKASAESQRCDTAAKSPEEKGACMKQFQTANNACVCPAMASPAPAPAK